MTQQVDPLDAAHEEIRQLRERLARLVAAAVEYQRWCPAAGGATTTRSHRDRLSDTLDEALREASR